MDFIQSSLQTIDTRDPRWVDCVVQDLLEGEAVIIIDGDRRCLIPGGRIDGPVWRYAKRYLRDAGIRVPRLRR
jgi:hypothetical protein